jgi:hypothetical protein
VSRNSKLRRDAKKKRARKETNRLKSNEDKSIKRSSFGPVMTMMDHPLSHITNEQRKELISELGKNGKEKVDEIFKFLNDLLRTCDPITLISILSGYGLTIGVGDDGVQSKESSGGLNQAHVEILQALALQIPEKELGCQPVTPDIVQEVWEKLIELSNAFSFSRMNEELLNASEAGMAINQIQEMIRGNTQMVRNWGFHSQVINISKEIYSHFDLVMLEKLGFSASNVIDTFKFMVESVEERMSKRLETLSELKSTKKPYELLIKYHELIGQGKEEADRFAKSIDIKSISQKNLFFMLLSHFDLRMADNYLFKAEQVASQVKLDKEIVDRILDYFSYSFGDLSESKKEYFFLDNPTWKKPIVSTYGGYFCPLPQLFFSFVLNILDEIVVTIDKAALHKRRADYLENKIEEIVKRRFPESLTVSGVKWDLDGIQYETDLITFIDSHAIIIEAKSQKISQPALRGAPDRIKKHLEEILIEPGIQSYRLEQKLNTLRLQESPVDSLMEKLPIDISKINKVLRVSVSLEDFATLQANFRLFGGTGWVPKDFLPCPSMNLADFETLFDFLEHPVQIVHYIQRRTELEGVIKFMGDELDFMGLYITTLLNIGNMISDHKAEIIISGMSEPLDKYYISRDQGVYIDKPQPKISQLFKNIFVRLEERGTPRWTEIGSILNRFPPDDQYKLSKFIKDLTKVVNKTWHVEGHKNIIIYNPPEASEYSLVIVLFKESNKDRRYEFIEHASALGIEPVHVKYSLVIAINIDKDDLPYHYIALFENNNNG